MKKKWGGGGNKNDIYYRSARVQLLTDSEQQSILVYLSVYWFIIGYLRLSWTISAYLRPMLAYLRLSLAIVSYLWLS